MSFSDVGVDKRLVEALSSMGIVEPTPVQRTAIPPALQGRNLMVESETGSGKTLAFLLPLIHLVDPERSFCQALVISPTRELASQTHRVFSKLTKAAGLQIGCALILGGASPKRQLEELRGSPPVIMGTSGRLLQLIRSGKIDVSRLAVIVLDEADRLFSAEATDETASILGMSSGPAAIWLYSATLGPSTEEAASPYAPDALILRDDTRTVLPSLVEHWCFLSPRRKKLELLLRLDASLSPERALLFTHRSGDVLNALSRLRESGIPAEALHGDFDGEKRHESLERFRSGAVRWLVTSDLGARGLDIGSVSHVFMLDAPDDERSYVHRAGRTGRNGRTGVCVALADPYELKRLSRIAVRLGISFKAKRLHSERIWDITLDEFFSHASDLEKDSKRIRRPSDRRPLRH